MTLPRHASCRRSRVASSSFFSQRKQSLLLLDQPMAAPRLNADPNLQICPDFGADEFALYRNALAAALDVTAEQAVENLAASWAIQNTTQKATWALQLEADAAIQRARDQEAEDAAAAIQAQADREADDALKILERKRPKMHTFNPLKSVGADILPHPSPYALSAPLTRNLHPPDQISNECTHLNESRRGRTFVTSHCSRGSPRP